MELIFEGDWPQHLIQDVAATLKKSLGTGEGEGAEATVQTTVAGLLSPRQRRLIELFRQGGEKAFLWGKLQEQSPESADPEEWEAYQSKNLAKAVVGTLQYRDGKLYQLNPNHRWQRYESDRPALQPFTGVLNFPVTDGEFGRGVYLPIARRPQNGLLLRVRLNLPQKALISDSDFARLEDDLTTDLNLLLNLENIGGVVRLDREGLPDLLFLRFPQDLQVLGVLGGSPPGEGDVTYHLLHFERYPDYSLADIEVRPAAHNTLTKAALKSTTALDGLPMRPAAPLLERSLVRAALHRLNSLGVDITGISIRLSNAVPNLLPVPVHAFCLPHDRTIYLAPHDPMQAIQWFTQQLGQRLERSLVAGAIAPETALQILQSVATFSPEDWLVGLLLYFVGAIRCWEVSCLMGGDLKVWRRYCQIAALRGWTGDRRHLASLAAQDYRSLYFSVPNFDALEWDFAVPTLAHLGQSELLYVLTHARSTESTAPSALSPAR